MVTEEREVQEPEVNDEQEFLDGFDADTEDAVSAPQEPQPEPDDVEAEDTATEPEAAQEDEPAPDPLKELEEKLSNRMRNLEGHFGGLNSKVQSLATRPQSAPQRPAEADAPTQQQVKEALASGEKFEELKADFPEFAAALEEQVSAVRGSFRQEFQSQDFQEAVRQAAAAESQAAIHAFQVDFEKQRLREQFPDYEKTASSPEFQDWLRGQPPEVYQLINSNYSADAAYVLNKYAAANQRRSQQRLESAVAPTRGSTVKAPSPSEEDEFLAAFSSG